MPISSASLSSPLLARRDWHYRACLAITGFYRHMDVRLLEAFRAVVDHRSVTQAAAAMRVTQPAVSAQIARLEQELGFPLFDRSNGRLKPTAEGMLFYAEADKVLTGMDRLSEAARQIRTAQAGRLIIASHPGAAISVLPALISAFVAERPGVHVRLLSRNSDVIGRLLPSESYDVGIAELPVDDAVVRLACFRVRCVAILSSTHPLASCPTLSPPTLSGQPAVALARTLQTSARVALSFAEAGAEWSPVVEAEYFASVCGLVASGAGWSVVDPLSARTFQHLGLITRPFEPAIYYEIGAFCARDREPSILAQSFLSMLVDKLGPLYT
jgi:DNA-binding transcriptional LysR family regulator